MKPQISIITPSYNQGQFIEDNLRSVLVQGRDEVEHIVVDGGSTDDTVDILKNYESKYNLRWVSEPDEGQANAFNKGLTMAEGEWIGWQNSDDFYLAGAFDEFIDVLERYPGHQVYYANKVAVDENGQQFRRRFYMRTTSFVYRYSGMTLSNQACFIHDSVFEELGGLDESLHFAMDHEFFLRLLLSDVSMRHVNDFWGASRYHSASKSRGGNEHAWMREHQKIYSSYDLPSSNDHATWRQIVGFAVRAFYGIADNGWDWVKEQAQARRMR